MEQEKTEKTERFAYFCFIDGCLLAEAKAVDRIHPINQAQWIIYKKLIDVPFGLLTHCTLGDLIKQIVD
ncbi:MAG: GxxExxY protein [bacterium]|nr:GxxExxY protein [bacterium]